MKVFHNIFVLLFYGASLISGGAFSSPLLYSGHPNPKKRRNQVSQLFVFSLLHRTFPLSLLFSSNHFFSRHSGPGSPLYRGHSESFLPFVFGCHVCFFFHTEPYSPSGKSELPLYHCAGLRNFRGENDTPPS